jgi:nicotinate dehydrogenase subunit A
MVLRLKVNGTMRSTAAEPDTPLLYVLRNDLELTGAKFGCGLAQCGACTVLVDGRATLSCVTPIGTLGESEITTIEGLGTIEKLHPLQRAFMEEQAAQCGYCINGMIELAAGRGPICAHVRARVSQRERLNDFGRREG